MTDKRLISAPIALERDIRPGALVRSRLMGKSLVLWRATSGQIHVWHDNCPHRSVRLSAGRNLGDRLEDIYHGWQFGEDATVISVPAEGGGPRAELSAQVVTSTISEGFVWATLGDTVEPDPGLAGHPLRPVPVNAQVTTVRRNLRRLPDVRLMASPWDEATSVIYGTTDDGDLENLRQLNTRLVTLQRWMERGGI